MDRITEHIERLLLRHDCVIIPGFGGFVLQSVPAVYIEDEHSFTPAGKEIVFNPTLMHNDGLLAESYMRKYTTDFKNALQLVREDVAVMKETLDDDSEFQFGRIGIFMKEGDRILFIPGKSSHLLFGTSSYGLPVFHYLSLASRKFSIGFINKPAAEHTLADTKKTGNPSKSKHIIYTIPVTRTFVRVLATAAAAAVLFLLVSTPVEDVNKASYSASFIPQEIMPRKTADEIVSTAFSGLGTSLFAENAALSDGYVTEPPGRREGIAGANGFSEDVDTGVKPVAEAKPDVHSETNTPDAASVKSPAMSPNGKTSSPSSAETASNAVPGEYYIIIGSFNTLAQARGHIKRLKGDAATHAGIIPNDGRFRVYAQHFSTRKPALSYLDKIRQNPGHEQAWLYKGR
jgi:cell division septation protein DedD